MCNASDISWLQYSYFEIQSYILKGTITFYFKDFKYFISTDNWMFMKINGAQL